MACNNSGVTITGQSGVVLNQCSINPTSPTNESEWGSLSAVTMTSSSGQLNNVNASLSIPANRHHSFAVMISLIPQLKSMVEPIVLLILTMQMLVVIYLS